VQLGTPKAFALVAVPLLCPHSTKRTLKRLNPVARCLPITPEQAGAACTPRAWTTTCHSPPVPSSSCPRCSCYLRAQHHQCPGTAASPPCGTWDKGWLFSLGTVSSSGLWHWASRGPTSPNRAPCSLLLTPPSWGQRWQLAHHRRGVRAACGQRVSAR